MPLPFYLYKDEDTPRFLGRPKLVVDEDPIDRIKGNIRGAIDELSGAAKIAQEIIDEGCPTASGIMVLNDLITAWGRYKRELEDFEADLTERQG